MRERGIKHISSRPPPDLPVPPSQRKERPMDKNSNPSALTSLAQRRAEGQTCLVWRQPDLGLNQQGEP